MTRSVLVAGSGVSATPGAVESLVELAQRTRTGVFNTCCAKGLFRFDDPAHFGTIGLQRDDLLLARLAEPDGARVVATGVEADEIPGGIPGHWERFDPRALADLDLPEKPAFGDRPPLYAALAAVCGPLYTLTSTPLSPVRAAGDLAAALHTDIVVTANAGLAAFWLGRTFPTRQSGSVRLPVRATHDVVAEVVASTAAVVVVCGPGDNVPDVVGAEGTVVVEHWSSTGPLLDPDQRMAAVENALSMGGVHHLEIGVDVDDVAGLVEVAGPVTAWGLA